MTGGDFVHAFVRMFQICPASPIYDDIYNGAQLRAPNVALPDEFTLLLDNNSSLKRRCKVIWRKGFTVGLKFVQA